jgi:hypothetical protein
MSESLLTEIASDHRHWLLEIERWETAVANWRERQRTFASEIADRVGAHGKLLEEHAAALKSLRHEIADCERAMMARKPDEALRGLHAKEATGHERQRAVHDRLQEAQHLLGAALAALKHGPNRQE